MRCPFCGNIDTQVKDSRPAEDNVSIRRRRYCSACAGRFTTYERVQLRDLVIVKKNNRREVFDRDKLERSVRIALQKRPIEIDRIEQGFGLLSNNDEPFTSMIPPISYPYMTSYQTPHAAQQHIHQNNYNLHCSSLVSLYG